DAVGGESLHDLVCRDRMPSHRIAGCARARPVVHRRAPRLLTQSLTKLNRDPPIADDAVSSPSVARSGKCDRCHATSGCAECCGRPTPKTNPGHPLPLWVRVIDKSAQHTNKPARLGSHRRDARVTGISPTSDLGNTTQGTCHALVSQARLCDTVTTVSAILSAEEAEPFCRSKSPRAWKSRPSSCPCRTRSLRQQRLHWPSGSERTCGTGCSTPGNNPHR